MVASGGRRVASSRIGRAAPTPVFFVSADSKGVAGEIRVSADSERLKVAVFSVSWERLASADSKGFIDAFSTLISILLGSADSKGVRRSAWRERMVRWVRKNRAELTKVL